MLVACCCPFVDSVTSSMREVGERWEVDDSRASHLVGLGLAVVCAEQPKKQAKSKAVKNGTRNTSDG